MILLIILLSLLVRGAASSNQFVLFLSSDNSSVISVKKVIKPCASEVLTCYLKQCKQPPWTSYFVKYSSVINDQKGLSHFNWKVETNNYHILRTGCYPYIKYHCSKRPYQDLSFDNRLMKIIKILNLGIPTLLYGLAATFLITHSEVVYTDKGNVTIYFLMKEDKGAQY